MQQGGKRLNEGLVEAAKVSIVCVTFNASHTLPLLFKSIEQYKPKNVEMVILDGDSTDNTVDIIKKNEHLVDFWLSEPDNGIYEAMNKATKYTKGGWIIFIGADDLISKGFGKMVSTLKEPDTVYYGNVIYYGKKFRKTYTDYFLTKLNICHQGIFYPKAVFEKYQYDTKYRVYADYHLNLRLWKDQEFKFVHRRYFVASFPEGGFSSYTRDDVFEAERDLLFKKYLKPASYYRYISRTRNPFTALIRMVLNT